MIIRTTHTCRVGEVSHEQELNIEIDREEPLSPEGWTAVMGLVDKFWALPLITPNGTVPAKENPDGRNSQ